MKTIDPTTTLGEIVRQAPERAQIFEKLGMEYCCLGNTSLKEACEAKAMDLVTVTRLLDGADGETPEPEIDLAGLSAPELCDYLERRYHGYFEEALPEARLLAKKAWSGPGACRVHATRLRLSIDACCGQISSQIECEQRKLYPLIRQACEEAGPNPRAQLRGAMALHEKEVKVTATALRRIRTLTHEFTPPSDSCPRIFALYAVLWDLDQQTRQHVHIQRNVLVGKAG